MWMPAAVAALVLGAWCEERSVIVVPTITGLAEPRLAAIHERAEAALSGRACIRTLSLDAAFALGEESIIDRCGADVACLKRGLVHTGADDALLVAVAGIAESVVTTVRFIDLSGDQSFAATETANDASSILDRLIARVLDDAGRAPSGRIEIVASPPSASVELLRDGERRALVAPTSVPPGSYELRVSAPGHVEDRRTIAVAPGEQVHLDVGLVEDASIFERWWFWSGVAVLVTGGVVAATVALQPGTTCHCSGSADRCAMICRGL